MRVLRGDGAGLAEEREEIQRPRRRPEDGWCVSDGGGGGGHLRGVYGWGEGHRIDCDLSPQFPRYDFLLQRRSNGVSASGSLAVDASRRASQTSRHTR